MIEGSCNCGAVRFELAVPPTDVIVCHCSICRRATGANGVAVVLVENDHFHWIGEEDAIRTWAKPDGDWHMSFCKVCGSPVPASNDETRMFVPAGLLVGEGLDLKVTHHIWVGSKAEWDAIGDGGKQHYEAFDSGD